MSNIMDILTEAAKAFETENGYCHYNAYETEDSLEDVLTTTLENLKVEGVIKDFTLQLQSFDISPALEISYVPISWVTKDGKLDSSVFYWEAC